MKKLGILLFFFLALACTNDKGDSLETMESINSDITIGDQDSDDNSSDSDDSDDGNSQENEDFTEIEFQANEEGYLSKELIILTLVQDLDLTLFDFIVVIDDQEFEFSIDKIGKQLIFTAPDWSTDTYIFEIRDDTNKYRATIPIGITKIEDLNQPESFLVDFYFNNLDFLKDQAEDAFFLADEDEELNGIRNLYHQYNEILEETWKSMTSTELQELAKFTIANNIPEYSSFSSKESISNFGKEFSQDDNWSFNGAPKLDYEMLLITLAASGFAGAANVVAASIIFPEAVVSKAAVLFAVTTGLISAMIFVEKSEVIYDKVVVPLKKELSLTDKSNSKNQSEVLQVISDEEYDFGLRYFGRRLIKSDINSAIPTFRPFANKIDEVAYLIYEFRTSLIEIKSKFLLPDQPENKLRVQSGLPTISETIEIDTSVENFRFNIGRSNISTVFSQKQKGVYSVKFSRGLDSFFEPISYNSSLIYESETIYDTVDDFIITVFPKVALLTVVNRTYQNSFCGTNQCINGGFLSNLAINGVGVGTIPPRSSITTEVPYGVLILNATGQTNAPKTIDMSFPAYRGETFILQCCDSSNDGEDNNGG